MAKKHRKSEAGTSEYAEDTRNAEKAEGTAESSESSDQNPPRTTTRGWLTTPKFGSATSGGGEIEPGPERD